LAAIKPQRGWLLGSAFLGLALLASMSLLPGTRETVLAQDQAEDSATTHIFFSAGCVDCWPYVEDVLLSKGEVLSTATESRQLMLFEEIATYLAKKR